MATILVIDDEAANRKYLATLLGYAGHRVLEASDGAGALAQARACAPDLAIADILMPGMDGYEFVRRLRSEPAISATPIIFYSGFYREQEARDLAAACGVRHLLSKPSDPEVVLSTVNTALDRPPAESGAGSPADFDREHSQLLTGKLTETVEDLKAANARIAQLNRALEARVAELTAVNKDLETFTSSVAHDLRAPLRHIDGFAKLLLEGAGSGLAAAQQDLLVRIGEVSRRMGQMIDGLLGLAHTGRREPNKVPARLKPLVEEALQELQAETSGRQIEWRIGELPCAGCDPALMKLVFTNLLSNAIKFTRPRQPAVIEVGRLPGGGAPVIFVRDNGVGFSMKHADKLFGPFQRLHRREDFEGNGIGLATVARIVRKHGGRIWAEAEPNRGATFYFTLGFETADEQG